MPQRLSWFIGSSLVFAAFVALAALLFMSGLISPITDTAASTGYAGLTHRLSADGAPLLGDPAADATVVVFLDYACPHCVEYSETIRALIDEVVRPGIARLEVRILSGLAPDESLLAARAALCAMDQTLFWEFQEELFTLRATYDRGAFTSERLAAAASRVGLDGDDLASCMANTANLDTRLQHTVDLALQVDIKTLPAVLIRHGNRLPAWILQAGRRQTGRLSVTTITGALAAGSTPRPSRDSRSPGPVIGQH
jgi:protein-disulfide isomerase